MAVQAPGKTSQRNTGPVLQTGGKNVHNPKKKTGGVLRRGGGEGILTRFPGSGPKRSQNLSAMKAGDAKIQKEGWGPNLQAREGVFWDGGTNVRRDDGKGGRGGSRVETEKPVWHEEGKKGIENWPNPPRGGGEKPSRGKLEKKIF